MPATPSYLIQIAEDIFVNLPNPNMPRFEGSRENTE